MFKIGDRVKFHKELLGKPVYGGIVDIVGTIIKVVWEDDRYRGLGVCDYSRDYLILDISLSPFQQSVQSWIKENLNEAL